MTLYEIDAEIMEIIENAVDPETGEIIDEVAMASLGDLDIAREKKIENMLLMVKNLESDAEQLKAEKQAFDQRQHVALNKAEWLKKCVQKSLAGEKFTTARVAVSYRKSTAVEYTGDVNNLPEECIKRKEPEVNKTALGKLLKGGTDIPGARLVERQNMQIK